MSVSDEIATKILVELDTTELDNLNDDTGIISGLKDAVDKVKKQLQEGASNFAEKSAEQLVEYMKVFFLEYDHPYSVGYSEGLWLVSAESQLIYLIDNMAVSESGYPYLDALEKGTNPYTIKPIDPEGYLFWNGAEHPVKKVEHPGIKAKPFAINAREALKMDIDKIAKETFYD